MGSKFQRFCSSAKMLKLQSWALELEDHHRITPNKNPWMCFLVDDVFTPWKMNGWTLKMMALEDDFPFQLGNF